jgi:hypothetical protein
MMSGEGWPEDFKILALSGKMEGPVLAFFDKMQPLWATEANTVDLMMDRMLAFYATRTPVTKAMELISEPKPSDRSWRGTSSTWCTSPNVRAARTSSSCSVYTTRPWEMSSGRCSLA